MSGTRSVTTKAAAAGRAGPSVVLAAWAWPLLLSRLCAGVRRAAARRPGRRSARPPQDLLLAGSTSSTSGLFWLSRITAHASYASGQLGLIPATGAGLGLPDPRPLRVRPASALEEGGRGPAPDRRSLKQLGSLHQRHRQCRVGRTGTRPLNKEFPAWPGSGWWCQCTARLPRAEAAGPSRSQRRHNSIHAPGGSVGLRMLVSRLPLPRSHPPRRCGWTSLAALAGI